MDNPINGAMGSMLAGGEYANWRYDASLQTYPWLPISYTSAGTSWTQNLSDSVTASDSVGKAIGKFLSDTSTTTDSLTKTIGLLRGDTVTISDALTKAITKLVADSVTPADALSRIVTYIRTLSDTVTGSDNISTSQGQALTLALSDAVTILDSFNYTNGVVISQVVSIIVDAASRSVTLQSESDSVIIDTEVKP